MPLPKLYDIFFRHNLSTRLHRKREGSLFLSEFEFPHTISSKQQQQLQQHIFFIKFIEKTNYPRHGTLDPRPSTLDKKIDFTTQYNMNRKTTRFILAVSAEHRRYNNTLYNIFYYIQICGVRTRTELSDSLHRIEGLNGVVAFAVIG